MDEAVDHVRAFNRCWTEVIGLLDQGLLETEHSLPEARVVFELAQRTSWDRSDLRKRLGMDASFLTRVLSRLNNRGLVASAPSPTDGRAIVLSLTEAGRAAFNILDERSTAQVTDMLAPLTDGERATLTESMTVISNLVRPGTDRGKLTLRGLEPGDMGWVIQRHGAIYWDEFGWDNSFEALVAKIVADHHHAASKADRERAWIAEVDRARAGCVFCCEHDPRTAQLRILLVEPWARGRNLGSRLVDECISFGRAAGYPRMILWTNDVLVSARRIYEAAGFVLVDEARHRSFGHELVGQNWELDLTRGAPS